jgi:predicted nucleotidyltransferase
VLPAELRSRLATHAHRNAERRVLVSRSAWPGTAGDITAATTALIRYDRFVAQVASPVEPTPSILPQFVARIVEVLKPVQVWLFGSRARGDARADSDWDFMAILPDDAPENDLDLCSVWSRLRDLELQRVEVFTMTWSDFEEWNRSRGTLAEIVARTGIQVYGA